MVFFLWKFPSFSVYLMYRFDTEEVVGTVVNRNRAVCIQPFLMAEGYVIFDVAIGDEKYNWKGKYFVGKSAENNSSFFQSEF